MHFTGRIRIVIIFPTVLIFSGCALGPHSMRYSLAQYNNAILQSSREQLFLNIIRGVYDEPPIFMEAGPIAANFAYSAKADFTSTIPAHALSSFDATANLEYTENPTITYTVLRGEKYATQLLRPMDIDKLGYLLGSTSLDIVFLTVIQQIGEINNRLMENIPSGQSGKQGFVQLKELTKGWKQLQSKRRLEIRQIPGASLGMGDLAALSDVKPADQINAAQKGFAFCELKNNKPKIKKYELKKIGPSAILIRAQFPRTSDKNGEQEVGLEEPEDGDKMIFPDSRTYVRKVKQYLGITLEPDIECQKFLSYTIKLVCEEQWQQCALEHGTAEPKESKKQEIPSVPIKLRSFIHMLSFITHAIDIPESDIGQVEDLANTTVKEVLESRGKRRAEIKDLMQIEVSRKRPKDAFVQTKYNGHYFYIKNTDVNSRGTFHLLSRLYELQAGEIEAFAPGWTVNVGSK